MSPILHPSRLTSHPIPGLLASAFALAFAFVGFPSAWALKPAEVPREQASKATGPVERGLYVRLPLEQVEEHWTFRDKAALLSGRLVVRISNSGGTQELIIFENGEMAKGWKPMPLPTSKGGQISFGFQSMDRFPTRPGDKLEVELTATKDLDGVGPLQSGILPAGSYKSTGSYNILIDTYDVSEWSAGITKEGTLKGDKINEALGKIRAIYEYRAVMDKWDRQWPLTITKEEGYLPPEQAEALRKKMKSGADPKETKPAR